MRKLTISLVLTDDKKYILSREDKCGHEHVLVFDHLCILIEYLKDNIDVLLI